MNAESRVVKRHRSTRACARCYRLKQKCDRGTPKCLRCVSAGVDCTGINRQTSTEIPRSPVQYLEQRLTELQRNGQDHQQRNGVISRADTSQAHQSHRHVLDAMAISITGHLSCSLFRSDPNIQHQAKLFYPSERPPLKIPVHGIYHDIYPRTAGQVYAARFATFNASKIPLDVARRLFDNYKDNILPRFPCFAEQDLAIHFEQVYDSTGTGKQPSHIAVFIVSLVLAISSLTSKRQDFRRVAALSESLHADAMRHRGFLEHHSFTTLQCLLLLIQLALLLPHTSNLWFLSGEAMRMAVSLGLHEEVGSSIHQDLSQAEQRRALFWLAYQLDRTVAIAAGCPIALSDEHITTQLPYNGGDPHANLDQFIQKVSHLHREKQFLLHVRVCIIQSEIQCVQFFDQKIPDHAPSYDAWVQKTRDSVQDLVKQVTADGFATSWLLLAAQQCQVLLHRPCSRNITVSTASLLDAASASMQLINTSLESAVAGGLVVTFEIANSAFQSGVVLLHALRNHTLELQHATLLMEGNESLKNLIQLFVTLAERWPALSDTAHYIKELVDTSLATQDASQRSAYDLNVLKELDCLVTQRRIHSIYHRNIPIPSKIIPDNSNETSPGFLEDEAWWRDFINEDFDMGDYLDPSETWDADVTAHPEMAISTNVPSVETAPAVNSRDSDFDKLLEALPACSPCRDRRVKCHRQLPACKECKRIGRECVIYDPVLSKNIPLSMVHSLAERVKELELCNDGPATVFDRDMPQVELSFSRRNVFLPQGEPVGITGGSDQRQNIADAAFFGPWTSLGCLRSLFTKRPDWKLPAMIEDANAHINQVCDLVLSLDFGNLSVPTMISLVHLFSNSTNTFFPILDESSLQYIISFCHNISDQDKWDTNREMLYLVLAVSCLIRKKGESSFAFLASHFFNKVASNLETTCNHSSRPENIRLLQRTLLICLYIYLNPESGDVWRHLGFAIRLFFDLSHRPSEDEDENQNLFSMLTRTLYSLESQISIAFGRPSLLIIGDNLREELTEQTSKSLKENISIFFYLVSFLKMKIHSSLLKKEAYRANSSREYAQSKSDSQDYRRELDEWLVRWTKVLERVGERQSRSVLTSWGELNYAHGLFMISSLWPTPGGQPITCCDSISKSCAAMARQEQLYANIQHGNDAEGPIIFPINWTTSHLVLQVGLHLLSEDTREDEKLQNSSVFQQCVSLLSTLETDKNNLIAGQSIIIEELIDTKGNM